jgi:cysteinyl-tRNA synthetase
VRQITIQDTLTGERKALESQAGKVGIYACGPTVYGRIHVGNARPYVVFSLFKRFLEHEGLDATLVVNVTDVNDKIYAAASEAGTQSADLAREMTAHYVADTDGLALGRPDHEPLATETIGEIVALIAALVDRGHAYESGGDVYFDVRSYDRYGELSHRDIDQMDQGEGVEGAALKRDPLDFALWKANKPGEDTAWDSPWGRGRPGWHIECSAMAEAILGVDFAVHGGGSDLVFPHHENEAAQTRAGRGEPLARIWMHNGMIELDREKMSKSVGNIFALHEALARIGRDALVMYFCGGHYRQPLAYSEAELEQARARVARVREAGRRLAAGSDSPEEMGALRDRFFDALAADFNTAAALGALFDWVREANRRTESGAPVGDSHLCEMLAVLGLENLVGPDTDGAGPPEDAVQLAERRRAAREAKDWAAADQLRDELSELGWEVRDEAGGARLVPREG